MQPAIIGRSRIEPSRAHHPPAVAAIPASRIAASTTPNAPTSQSPAVWTFSVTGKAGQESDHLIDEAFTSVGDAGRGRKGDSDEDHPAAQGRPAHSMWIRRSGLLAAGACP